jgi:hypothetical protein
MHLPESQDAGNGLIHKHLRASQGWSGRPKAVAPDSGDQVVVIVVLAALVALLRS